MDTAHVAGVMALAAIAFLFFMRKAFASVNVSIGR